ncbi:MAG TPA: LLM class flavin-dependent oxidoreductase [Actinomycetota bacterium]
MKIGLVLPLFSGDVDRVRGAATRAEALGFDGVFAFDHLFPPGATAERPSLEAFAMLSAVASSTERVAVGTLVTRATLRSAGLVAKAAATIDAMGGGRMILGIGTGDPIDRAEHDTFGFPYLGTTERREHLVETVRAIRALFRGEAWPGAGHVPPMDGPLLPAPARPPGPPIWIGGFADAVVEIAAREADAWNGWGMDVAEFERKTRLLRDVAAGRDVTSTWAGIAVVGRDRAEAESALEERKRRGLETDVWAGSGEDLAEHLGGLASAGASWAVLVVAGPAPLERVVEIVMPRVR